MSAVFGPAGNCELFYEEGNKSTLDAPAWIKSKGLDIFEYSFGRGYSLPIKSAESIGKEFQKENIELSLHAPYFINFANPDDEMYEKTKGYIRTGIKFLRAMGAKRLVFHPGSCGKMKREEAVSLMNKRIKEFVNELDSDGLLDGIYLCPETMGKSMQLGTVGEILEICSYNKHLLPTFDFGHINARTGGSLKTKDDFMAIFNQCKERIGEERTNQCHIHFSKIEYGEKGEIRHLNFDDKIYGPNFEPLAECLKELNISPHIICESAGKQAEDALFMKNIYQNTRQNW